MERLGNGVGRSSRGLDPRRARVTLRGMRKSAWYWLGWACLTCAVLGIFDQWFPIGPAVQFLLIGAGIMAFHFAGTQLNNDSEPSQPA